MHQIGKSQNAATSFLGEEAYRGLHTHFFRSFVANPPKIAMLTSPVSSETKNRTCADLAVALARAGKNTLVLDRDSDGPALHKLLGLPKTPGMKQQVLVGERGLREVWTQPMPGLTLLPAGLVRLTRLSKFLASSSSHERFDCVLVNAPPIGISFEPLCLASHGCPVLLVLEARTATGAERAVGQAVSRLKAVGARFLLAPVPSDYGVGSPRYLGGGGARSRARIEHLEEEEDAEQQAPATGEQKPSRAGRFLTKKAQDVRGFLVMLLVSIALFFGVVKPFIVEAFYIPTESMVPTLEVNDRVLVNKLAYRFSQPERGDIIVFEDPDGPTDLIKRVEGVAGDSIAVEHGSLILNGQRLDEPYINGELPDESTYGLTTVPEGHVFAMGDNRAESADSRVFGPVPEEYVIGKAFVRVWPLNRMEGL